MEEPELLLLSPDSLRLLLMIVSFLGNTTNCKYLGDEGQHGEKGFSQATENGVDRKRSQLGSKLIMHQLIMSRADVSPQRDTVNINYLRQQDDLIGCD